MRSRSRGGGGGIGILLVRREGWGAHPCLPDARQGDVGTHVFRMVVRRLHGRQLAGIRRARTVARRTAVFAGKGVVAAGGGGFGRGGSPRKIRVESHAGGGPSPSSDDGTHHYHCLPARPLSVGYVCWAPCVSLPSPTSCGSSQLEFWSNTDQRGCQARGTLTSWQNVRQPPSDPAQEARSRILGTGGGHRQGDCVWVIGIEADCQ